MVMMLLSQPAQPVAFLKVQHPYEAAAIAAFQPSWPLTAAYLRKHGRGAELLPAIPAQATCT